jgi:excisionase family DNA binding protein
MMLAKLIIEDMIMLKDIDISREYITTPQAAERSGLSKVYLAQLLRKGTLEGFQVGRDWCVYTDSLERFLATPRKSGPKGPRKKTGTEV